MTSQKGSEEGKGGLMQPSQIESHSFAIWSIGLFDSFQKNWLTARLLIAKWGVPASIC